MGIIKNIGWLIFDKIFIIVLQFLVGIKIINFYGAEIYGYYSYAISLIALFPIFVEVMNARIIKLEYYKNKNSISTVVIFYLILSIIPIIILLSLKNFYNLKFFMILLLLLLNNIFIIGSIGIELYFEYKLQSKNIVISNIISKILILIMQYYVLLYKKDINYIALSQIIGNLIRYIFLKYYLYKVFCIEIKLELNIKLVIELIRKSKFFWIANSSHIIFMQLDRLMIGKILGVNEVAIYTVALQLISVLEILFIPISNSIFTKMIEMYQKNYKKYLKFLLCMNTYLTYGYIIISIVSILVLKKIFPYLISNEYRKSLYLYQILTIATILKANILLRSSHLALINKGEILFKINILGAISNIILNLFLIPKFGVIGAVFSSILSRILMSISSLFLDENQEWNKIQLQSFNFFNLRLYREMKIWKS